jgi:TDG/mug DNA glycosylase family protein
MHPERKLVRGLPPVLGKSPVVLILGSFPSTRSLAAGEYYGNPRNQFWPIMEEVLGIDRTLPYPRRLECLREARVALWDVVATCERTGSSDASIRDATANDLSSLLNGSPSIRHIVLNGRTGAGRWFDRLLGGVREIPGISVEIFPSTSPANARLSLQGKVAVWKRIREYVRA